MQIVAIAVSFALTGAALVFLVPAVRRMLGVIRSGQPDTGRTGNPTGRAMTMLKETFLHTRMLQWHWVGVMHWFVYAAFLFLSTAVLAAYFQLFEPSFAWPLVGHWYPYEWFSELIGLLSTIGIVYLIVYRQKHHPRSEGRRSRFFGSNFWQAYFVEALALLEGAAILFVRAAEWKLDEDAGRSHYPIASWIGDALYTNDASTLENVIYGIAAFKIALAMIWLIVIARNITMGIAWHRFTAWFNIYFKREDDGSTALGAMKPLTSAGKAITLDDIDDLDEDSVLGAGKVEDFSWKGILDFTTCTECGRCQSQCPAWNTEKPLSPKLLITSLRDHAYAKHDAATGAVVGTGSDGTGGADGAVPHSERQLVGVGSKGESAGAGTDVLDYFYNPADGDFVIDEDVLWSCTSCGACVQQCPVDIEHVDHIMDMRRYQLLVESNFPAELNQLFKGLENKGNPWNMSPSSRLDWAKGLDFEVKVVGEDLESLESVDWLFWVGCAGAYEDRAKKTTRAVAELLDMAGISFGVLGNGETCTGDPARRAGNEFVFQGLAQQNAETFKEHKVKKVVSTCAHCFNTLKNEYKDFGVELEVVHHTQLLNRLVREGKLTPVKDGAGAAKRSITYHDPCYLGRHNQVYEAPRELLEILPGAEFVEMERNSERSFCCGAGGARMWMEENLGERINMNRTKEAVGTGADQIAVGCPFCRVMLSDGLTSQQAKGEAREEVEVLDVAQMLLASVKGEQATKAAPGSAGAGAHAAAAGAAAASTSSATDVATKDEPEAGDVTVTEDTVTETADVGPAAKASGGTSLFDTPADSGGSLFDTPAPAAEEAPAKPADDKPAEAFSGGSLFDTPAPEPTAQAAPTPAEPQEPAEAPAEPPAESKAEPAPADLGSGGSLFDLGTPEPEAAAPTTAEPSAAETAETAEAAPAPVADKPASPSADLGSGGSLFDIAAPDPTPAAEPEATAPEATAAAEAAKTTAPEPQEAKAPESEPAAAPGAAAPSSTTPGPTTETDLSSFGSLFDIEAPAAAEPTPPASAQQAVSDEPDESPEATTVEPEVADPPSSGETSTPATDADISSVGSLFDLEAPAAPSAPAAPAAPAATPDPEAQAEREAEPEAQAAPEEATAPPSGADLSQAATFRDPEDLPAADAEAPAGADDVPAEDPETILDADDEPAEELAEESAEPHEPAEEEPAAKPSASSSPAHSPRTDADIDGAGSLFDL